MKAHKLPGFFEVKSGTLRISDPCYDKETWCAGTVSNVLLGYWKGIVLKKKFKGWGNRVCELQVVHEFAEDLFRTCDYVVEKLPFSVGVDSGCAGIFDDVQYQVDFTEEVALKGRQQYDQHSYDHSFKMHEDLRKATQYLYEQHGQKYEDSFAELLNKPRAVTVAPLGFSKEWYDVACDPTFSNIRAGCISGGACSSAGFGDGSYTAFAARNKTGKIIGVKIVFIGKDEI